jgi:chaperonin cofactor prefoldin
MNDYQNIYRQEGNTLDDNSDYTDYIDWLEQRLEKVEEKNKNYKDTLEKIRTGKF